MLYTEEPREWIVSSSGREVDPAPLEHIGNDVHFASWKTIELFSSASEPVMEIMDPFSDGDGGDTLERINREDPHCCTAQQCEG